MLTSESFGDCNGIEAGSLVEWSFDKIGVGLLLSAGNVERGGRKVAMAKVKKLKSSEIVEICCLVLRKHTIKTS
jgi:hypothetical protein